MAESDTYTNEQYKFSIDYPKDWIVESAPLDMTEPGSTTVSSQIRVVALHSNVTTTQEAELKYEELMVMRQVLKVGKDLESFTEMVLSELKMTTRQIRQMGIQINDEIDNVVFQDTEIAGYPAKCASLPIYMPIQNEEGMIVVYRRPTYQKWCLLDSHTALVLTYLAADCLFEQRLDAVRDIMASFKWTSPPAFPDVKPPSSSSSSLSSSSSSSSLRASLTADEALDFLIGESGDDASPAAKTPTTPIHTDKAQKLIYESKTVTIFDEDGDNSKPSQEAFVLSSEKKEEEKKEEEKEEKKEEKARETPVVVPTAYKWEQGDPDISITFTVPSGTTKRDMVIEYTPTTILAGLKNQPPVIEGTLFAEVQVVPDDIVWYREDTTVTIQFNKKDKKQKWDVLVSKQREQNKKDSIDTTSLFFLGQKFAAEGNHAAALGLYRAAANKHHLQAMMKSAEVLSGCNPKERSFGKISTDRALAVHYWRLAAAEPHLEPEAMFRLGLAAFYGVEDSKEAKGEKQSAKEALKWFDKASLNHVKALYYGGVIRISGGIPSKIMQNGILDDVPHAHDADTIVETKKDNGLKLLRKAATLSSMDAMIALGHLAYSGLLPGIEQIGPDEAKKDLSRAKDYFDKAKALDTNKTWSGPPKEFLEAIQPKKKQSKMELTLEKDKAASRGIEVSTTAEEEPGVSTFLWDNAIPITVGLVGVSFVFHWYKKLS